MLLLIETQLRAWVRRWLGDESGQAVLLIVLLLAFLIWVMATHRRIVIQ
jgi:hypothetical protein